MGQTLKVYLVKSIGYEELAEVCAFFDSIENAEAFLDRFKTKSEGFEIVEFPLNPKYIVNRQEDPYMVSFLGTDTAPLDLNIYDFIEHAESAEKEEYEINFFLDDDTECIGNFRMMLFAVSEEEAVAKAIKKREEVIASGEWDRAYQDANLNKPGSGNLNP